MSEEIGRRDALARVAALALTGPIEFASAQHVHQEIASHAAGGVYNPKALTAHEFDTLRTLCELIVPGASEGRAAEFIDLLAGRNAELLAIYTGGIAWLDQAMRREAAAAFLSAKGADRVALLNQIAYRRNETPELEAGIRFFAWVRRMTVDAYYTSAAGIEEVGYKGNQALAKFEVPQDAIDYALKRSGL